MARAAGFRREGRVRWRGVRVNVERERERDEVGEECFLILKVNFYGCWKLCERE